ncbi:DNA repair protein RecO [Candidatus Paracaedibacter symbiosus]|uniref:DNA repair protein RecO n=1 Tax=Candidatus Paracaedibacter symbiosus TaxID=244582 RepID=UPI00050983CD|nr:DNA repair protein RecO [Candidatus Paracaedibacter symbiosus]
MQWTDVGVILNARVHGERSHIVTIYTKNQGRCAGLFKSSAKTKAAIQPGNLVQAKWSARLPEHLGLWQLELMESPSSRILSDRLKLNALGSALALADYLMAERHQYEELYDSLTGLITQLTHCDNWYQSYSDYELKLLEDLGFGLDLTKCAVTGTSDNLTYISPKTGRAVSAQAGLPYADRLFKIPDFWLQSQSVSPEQLYQALVITSYFFEKDLLEKGLPSSRVALQNLIGRSTHTQNT